MGRPNSSARSDPPLGEVWARIDYVMRGSHTTLHDIFKRISQSGKRAAVNHLKQAAEQRPGEPLGSHRHTAMPLAKTMNGACRVQMPTIWLTDGIGVAPKFPGLPVPTEWTVAKPSTTGFPTNGQLRMRIALVLERLGVTEEEFISLVPELNLRAWFRSMDAYPPGEWKERGPMDSVADHLGCSSQWLWTGEGDCGIPPRVTPVSPSSAVEAPAPPNTQPDTPATPTTPPGPTTSEPPHKSPAPRLPNCKYILAAGKACGYIAQRDGYCALHRPIRGTAKVAPAADQDINALILARLGSSAKPMAASALRRGLDIRDWAFRSALKELQTSGVVVMTGITRGTLYTLSAVAKDTAATTQQPAPGAGAGQPTTPEPAAEMPAPAPADIDADGVPRIWDSALARALGRRLSDIRATITTHRRAGRIQPTESQAGKTITYRLSQEDAKYIAARLGKPSHRRIAELFGEPLPESGSPEVEVTPSADMPSEAAPEAQAREWLDHVTSGPAPKEGPMPVSAAEAAFEVRAVTEPKAEPPAAPEPVVEVLDAEPSPPVTQPPDEGQRTATFGGHELAVRGEGDEARMRDTDLAMVLGMDPPRNIRINIKRAIKAGIMRPCVRIATMRTQMPTGGVRETKIEEFWLTKREVIDLIAHSRMPKAEELRGMVNDVYAAVIDGKLPAPAPSTALAPSREIQELVSGVRELVSGVKDMLVEFRSSISVLIEQSLAPMWRELDEIKAARLVPLSPPTPNPESPKVPSRSPAMKTAPKTTDLPREACATSIVRRARKAMRARQLSQREVSVRMVPKVHFGYVGLLFYRVDHGRMTTLSPGTVRSLAKAIDCPLKWLAWGEGKDVVRG